MQLSHKLLGAALVIAPVIGVPIVQAQIATSDLTFARGSTAAAVNASIVGGQTRDYVVRARAGQTMRVTMTGSPIVFFNVLPPGSADEAIFIGSNEGNSFSGTLSVSGPYKIRVYQMRATARRGQIGKFALRVSVTGGGTGGGGATNGSPGGAGSGLGGIRGMNAIAAIDAMRERGFANVDSFTTGNTQYGIYFSRSTRVCAQLTMADGMVLDARDIRTHPKCR